MVAAGNPIQSGLVTSLARPGGNVTGMTNLVPELLGKRLELLKETVPKAVRFAFLDDDEIVDPSPFKYAQKTAQALGVMLERLESKELQSRISWSIPIGRQGTYRRRNHQLRSQCPQHLTEKP